MCSRLTATAVTHISRPPLQFPVLFPRTIVAVLFRPSLPSHGRMSSHAALLQHWDVPYSHPPNARHAAAATCPPEFVAPLSACPSRSNLHHPALNSICLTKELASQTFLQAFVFFSWLPRSRFPRHSCPAQLTCLPNGLQTRCCPLHLRLVQQSACIPLEATCKLLLAATTESAPGKRARCANPEGAVNPMRCWRATWEPLACA